MSTFPITVRVDNKNLVISWTNQPNVRYLDIQLQRTTKDNAKPYYTKRVSSGHTTYALVPRYVFAYPVLAPASVDAHVGFESYKAWTDGPINDFGVRLGKNTFLARWSNTWGSVGYFFNGVVWTGQNGAIASTRDGRPCNYVVLDLGDAKMASRGNGTAITSPFNGMEDPQKSFFIGEDGSVNILRILRPEHDTYNPGETTTIAPAGSAMTIGSGSVCVVYHSFDSFKGNCWEAWWVSPDGHLSHVQCLGAPQTFPKTWGRTKVWHDDDGVSALTVQSLKVYVYGSEPGDNSDFIMWLVAKHGTGQKGNLYQTSRVAGEVSTTEVQQDDSECFVAPGSGISSERSDNGPIVAWITADGAVMTLLQDFKVENDPVFNQIAPPGSAALESTVRLNGPYIWWFGPNYELMWAYSSNRFQEGVEWKDVTWSTWEVLPAGVGRKGKDSIASSE
ncbi:hypothetical protein EYR41_009955 [Orbilia oligospora]|uniref:Uncharacterized protein n=1 Tax=Orbilia oligospora TaxID=2813651 RepID=A0A7C8PM56_ORBOL|nr:hypothetical protein TWF751_005495 [Orbilia oligospora]TGJ63865.1 hypothetical protein EYR41_009955 [Orbilia oligospora]